MCLRRIGEAEASAETKLATKADIARLEGGLKLIKWMLSLVIGGVLALVLKTFF